MKSEQEIIDMQIRLAQTKATGVSDLQWHKMEAAETILEWVLDGDEVGDLPELIESQRPDYTPDYPPGHK